MTNVIYNDINVIYNGINLIYNKTGTRQCTRSVFSDIDSTRYNDALFGVTGILRLFVIPNSSYDCDL